MNKSNKSIVENLAKIATMRGPAQGHFVVFVSCPANGHDFYGPLRAGGYSPAGAAEVVRDNPRLELEVIEKWILD